MTTDVKYDTTTYDGTPASGGRSHAPLEFDNFDEDLLNYAATKVDTRGFSLADHLMGVDEGGPAPGAPQFAGNAQAIAKQTTRAVEPQHSESKLANENGGDGGGGGQAAASDVARAPAAAEASKTWRQSARSPREEPRVGRLQRRPPPTDSNQLVSGPHRLDSGITVYWRGLRAWVGGLNT